MRLSILIGAAVLAGCSANAEQSSSSQTKGERELAKAIGDRKAGAPVDCVDSLSVDGPQIIDHQTVVYRRGPKVWVNKLAAECPNLESFNTMIVELHGSQICRNDQFRVKEPGSSIPGPYCRFGSFTPYSK